MQPNSTPEPTGADAVFARVMAEQSDAVQPARPSSDATLAQAPDVAGPQVPGAKHYAPVETVDGNGGPDGKDVEGGVAGYLDYLSRLAQQLGVPDPVEEYFAPVVGRWSDLHAEAERWRAAAKTADEATQSLTKPLGSLDSAWRGKDADAFVQYMGKVGLAGNDLSDAMGGMAKALDKTANSIRQIVQQMAGMLADTAESTSEAMTVPAKGDNRVRMQLDESRRPTKELFDAVRQVLEAFVKLCDGVEGGATFDKIQMKHSFPEQNFPFPDQGGNAPKLKGGDDGTHASGTGDDAKKDDKTAGGSSGGGHAAVGGGGGGGGSAGGGAGGGGSAGGGSGSGGGGMSPAEKPTPGGYVGADEQSSSNNQQSAAAASAGGTAAGGAGQGQRSGGVGGMPMMGGGMGGGQGGDQEHKRSARVVGDPTDIFGRPTKTSPSVIGEDE